MTAFPLPRSLTIRTIRDVHQSITDWIGESDRNVLDGHRVQELDTSGIQLLASLVGASEVAANPITLIDSSVELKTALQRAGLNDLLRDNSIDNHEQTGSPS
jgi:anti-anti-sigma regulatory factor